MNTFRILSSVFVALFLVSCAPNQLLHGLGLHYSDDKVESYACPQPFTPDQFRLQLNSSQPIPSKLAVMVDGKLKYDECLSSPNTPEAPYVKIRKSESNILDIVIYSFPAVKPASMSFEVFDRGDCSAASSSFFVVNDMPITFETHYYDEHHECGSYQAGEATISQ